MQRNATCETGAEAQGDNGRRAARLDLHVHPSKRLSVVDALGGDDGGDKGERGNVQR